MVVIKSPKIGIIGGKGRMGAALVTFFRGLEYEVLISDQRTRLSNIELAQKADVVIISVNIDRSIEVIEEVVPHVHKSALLMDVTSIKEFPVRAMLKSKAAVIGLHPMCNETTFGPGQTLIYCPARPEQWKAWLVETFGKRGGLKLVALSPKKHDEMMSYVQALIHFSEFALGKTLSELHPKLEDLLKFASPASQLKLKIAARHLAQDSNLYGNIQIRNVRNPKILEVYERAVADLCEIVKNGDLKAFDRYFNQGKKFFGDFGKKAVQETDKMILSSISAETSTEAAKFSKNAIVTLGPDLSYTSMATKKWKRSRKNPIAFLKTVEEIIEAVDQGRALYGVVPIENRLHGTVRATLDALFENEVKIIEELKMPIEHIAATLCRSKKLNINKIISHSQALNQCSKFIRKAWGAAKWIQVESTSAAFKHIQKTGDRMAVVIGPEPAAKHFGFTVSHRKIANDLANSTTFVVIAKQSPKIIKSGNPKTSIVFHFGKNRPGTLFGVFQIFADLGINLSRIESRPAPKKLGEYLFYLDFDGSAFSGKGEKALHEVKKVVGGLKVLGTY